MILCIFLPSRHLLFDPVDGCFNALQPLHDALMANLELMNMHLRVLYVLGIGSSHFLDFRGVCGSNLFNSGLELAAAVLQRFDVAILLTPRNG